MNFLRRIKDFVIKPQNLVFIFLIAMLVPNIVLTFTESYCISTILASMLIPAGFYMAFTMIRPRPGVMILWAIPFMVLCAFQLVISYLFGNSIIAIDMFTNVFTTNVSEAGELLGNIYPSVIIVIVIYVPLIVFAILSTRAKQSFAKQQRIHGVTLGIVLIMLGFGSAGISKVRNPEFGIKYQVFPVNVSYNIGQSIKRWNKSMNYPETSKDFRFNSVKEWSSDRREVYVMVIGEASRAMSWSMYGYERHTNPRLEQRADNMSVFKDLITQSNTTHKSVPILLSPSSAEDFENIYHRKSVVDMFSEAGFKTVFISNQPANRSLTDFFAQEADTLINITPQDLFGAAEKYDFEAVPVLRGLIEQSDDNLFVVIHTYGSHATHHKRYPREFAEFVPDQPTQVKASTQHEVINAYDNTILYTDYVLDGLIGTLDDFDICASLVYCSDHGEDLLDDYRHRFLHASPTTTYYQLHVPAFGWYSDEYIEVFPERFKAAQANEKAAATTSSIFHTIGEIADIKCEYIDYRNSLVSPLWEDLPRKYINDYNRAVNVLETGLQKIDLQLFDQHEIKYDRMEYIIERL